MSPLTGPTTIEKLCVLICAYNEEETIKEVIEGVKTQNPALILVVDDGSKDRTGTIAEKAGAVILTQPETDRDLFISVRARLPIERQAKFDAFMVGYMDFNALFDKSESDLIAMNQKFAEYYASVIALEDTSDEVEMPQQGQPGGWMVWAQYLSMGKRHDYSSALADVDVPVLVIHGADDLQSEAASRIYVDAFPNSKFIVIENATHFAFGEQPEIFADVVGEFLEK